MIFFFTKNIIEWELQDLNMKVPYQTRQYFVGKFPYVEYA